MRNPRTGEVVTTLICDDEDSQSAMAIARQLKYSGYDADLLVPDNYDVSLRARVERANTWCR